MSRHFFESPEPIDIPENTPLVFLEGPVQGAPNWQTEFGHRLLEEVPDIAVASPRALPGHQANFAHEDPEVRKSTSDRQVAYEFLARRLAFHYGAIALWYSAKDSSLPYPENRPYAKTTEKEDSEVWGMMYAYPDYPLVLGVDPAYSAGSHNSMGYIRRNHDLLDIKEHDSLAAVFDATVETLERVKREGSRPIPSLTSQSIRRALDRLDSE